MTAQEKADEWYAQQSEQNELDAEERRIKAWDDFYIEW